MHPIRLDIIVFFCVLPIWMHGQSFIFNQFFQPSIRFNSQYSHDFNLTQQDRLHSGIFNINCIIPVKSKLQLKVDWKKILTLRFKKAAKLKVYQIFWNFRPRMMYLDLRYANENATTPFQNKPQLSYGFSTGITGIHLITKKLKTPKFLFYSVTVGMMEDFRSVQRTPIPDFSLLVGMAKMKSLKFYWYYGLYFSYNNGLIIPAPFFGFQAKIAKKCWLNMTLPVQIKIAWKISKSFKMDVGVGLAGLSTAFGFQNNSTQTLERYVIGGFRLKTGFNFNFKLGPQTKLYLELGCYPYRDINFRWNNPPFEDLRLGPSFYGGLNLFYSFKKSLLGATIDGIIMF